MRTVTMQILVNMIYGVTKTTFPIRIRIQNHNRLTIKQRTINRRQHHPAVHHPVPVAVDRVQNPDRNHIHALAQSQIRNTNRGRLVGSTVNRNLAAMVEVAVQDVQILGQGIVDRIGRPEHDLEADHHNEVVNIMMDVVARVF